MLRNFEEVIEQTRKLGGREVAVAAAGDREVLEAVRLAGEKGVARGLLVGDEGTIRPLAEELGLGDLRVVHEPDPAAAAVRAAELVHRGEAQVLLKGLVNSSDFMRGVLHPEKGLRTGRLLSHLAVFQIPGTPKLAFHTDGGINIAPDLEAKKGILANALAALAALGYDAPKVAAITANEQVNPKMPATVDAAGLVEAWKAGAFEVPCVVEGPIALDVALSPEAARHKGIESAVSGDVDLFLMPNIEAGNVAGKSLLHYAGAQMAGLVLGAAAPVVLTSRAETAQGKLVSIALACLAAAKG